MPDDLRHAVGPLITSLDEMHVFTTSDKMAQKIGGKNASSYKCRLKTGLP
jgi:hypothetical protein